MALVVRAGGGAGGGARGLPAREPPPLPPGPLCSAEEPLLPLEAALAQVSPGRCSAPEVEPLLQPA